MSYEKKQAEAESVWQEKVDRVLDIVCAEFLMGHMAGGPVARRILREVDDRRGFMSWRVRDGAGLPVQIAPDFPAFNLPGAVAVYVRRNDGYDWTFGVTVFEAAGQYEPAQVVIPAFAFDGAELEASERAIAREVGALLADALETYFERSNAEDRCAWLETSRARAAIAAVSIIMKHRDELGGVEMMQAARLNFDIAEG